MGMPSSKFGKEIQNNDELQEASVPSTPTFTPIKNPKEMDPRSPSLNIARTPLELLSAAAAKLEPYEGVTPLKNKNIIHGIDPRSPTVDFKRTPIILSTAEGDLPRKIHNKNLDKARLAEIQTTPPSSSEHKSAVPPKLLESSPINPRSDAHKRRSLIGLLETNIDFTETDLDRVLKEKCNINLQGECKTEKDENITSVETEVPSIEDSLEQAYSNKVHDTPEEIQERELNSEEIKESDLNSEEIEVSAQYGNKSDSQIGNGYEKLIEEHAELEAVEVHIPNKTKSAPPSPINIPLSSILRTKEAKLEPVIPSFVDLTADVKELDKKLTNLIYEDDLVVCPRIVQLKENIERSPLKNRNCNEPRVKSAQKLKVSDKPRRSDYTVSKIPVFTEKRGGKVRNAVQCENTPPRNVEKSKIRLRKSDWDTKDTTLYL